MSAFRIKRKVNNPPPTPKTSHKSRLIEINTHLGTIREEGLAPDADISIIAANKRVKLEGK